MHSGHVLLGHISNTTATNKLQVTKQYNEFKLIMKKKTNINAPTHLFIHSFNSDMSNLHRFSNSLLQEERERDSPEDFRLVKI